MQASDTWRHSVQQAGAISPCNEQGCPASLDSPADTAAHVSPKTGNTGIPWDGQHRPGMTLKSTATPRCLQVLLLLLKVA
jgi:hypothetical protein